MKSVASGKHNYLILNGSFTAIILLIFLYSMIYSNEKDNHPIPSFYEQLTKRNSPTSGLSRSFSKIVRGNLKEARALNPNGILLFLFFLIQLFFRLITTFFLLKSVVRTSLLVTMDTTLSIILFLFTFRHLLAFWNFL